MAEQLTNRKYETLRWWIHGGVARKPIDVKSLEVHPHRVRRIRKPEMRERISHQQIAEFVMNAWRRNRQARKKCEACTYNEYKQQDATKKVSPRKRQKKVPNEAGYPIARFPEDGLKKKEDSCGKQCLLETASQRIQIGRVRTEQCEHVQDDTGERFLSQRDLALGLDF